MVQEERTFSQADYDFDALYAGRATFEGSEPGTGFIPWDIGEPQPVVVELARAGGFRGKVLDAGCGLGENAIMLAAAGLDVTGVDGSPSAIEQAARRAAEHGVQASFKVADATELRDIGTGFATVLDSGLYHCLNGEQRSAYAAALHRVSRPGATLHLFCFAESVPAGTPIAQEVLVSANDLHTHLDRHWEIEAITETAFATGFTRELLTAMWEAGAPDVVAAPDQDGLRVDERGRVLTPMSHVRARRR
ncbi:class I SAM-dependent methyltransferase [Spongiactinospora rosea]|uniref:Class I SAM-dependent methyltransferase n=1 Tax=Spongiactinospora rosea TaxID=2248750 RepID=A0A366LZR9_9ACTN|nr:class I SAM-dependent methyltransferase [Spongiactinospora rosea]RBQ19455.1 class I SAM-dependent methyltransferase [Spongiactinospora rosea]